MLIAYLGQTAYAVASQNSDSVELLSFSPVEGFSKVSPYAYVKSVPFSELDGLYNEYSICTYQDNTYNIIGEDEQNYYLLNTDDTILEVLKEQITDIQIQKLPITL